jgi:glycosyltransferase involved in cell wall biosynthesis
MSERQTDLRRGGLGSKHRQVAVPPAQGGRRTTRPHPIRPATGFTARPRSILFISWRDLSNPLAGGSEQLVHELASGLARRGYETSLLCGGPVEPQRLYKVTAAGGEYSQYMRAPIQYFRTHRGTDLVVEVCNGMPFLIPLWRRGPSLCLVNHIHTELWRDRFNPLVASFGRTVEAKVMPWIHRGNLIMTISPSTRASLQALNVPEEQIRHLPQGYAIPPPLHPKSARPLFVAVGRLVGYKRIELLLEMWRSVYPVTGGRLVVVGGGQDRERLEALGGEGVEFTGFVSEAEKHRLMCEAWVLLHPASWEGWGLVITEAAVRGTPAVGFDVPGVRDAILDGQTGLLAATDAEFVGHWLRLAESAELRAELAEAAMKGARSTSWSETVDAFESIAAEAVARHHTRSPGRNRAVPYPSVDAV